MNQQQERKTGDDSEWRERIRGLIGRERDVLDRLA
jgi:FtsZ-binding cell division protein ZapB